MQKKWAIGILLILALLAGAYIGSPYWTVDELRAAAVQGDADKLDAVTDMPAIRESLKSQISAALLQKMRSDPDLKDNPFAGLGALILPAVVDKMIDGYITPDGLVAIMQGKNPTGNGANDDGSKLTYNTEYLGLDRFRLKFRKVPSNEPGPSFLLERREFFSWKLIRIELPPNAFDGLSASSPPTPSADVPSPDDTMSDSAEQAPNGVSYIDTETQKLPDVGQCFQTTVNEFGSRLEGVPDSGSWVGYRDGHHMIDYEVAPQLSAWHLGDRVRLCVIDLPKNCPAGDNRGVGYRATNLRTGSSWEAADSEHTCGGA